MPTICGEQNNVQIRPHTRGKARILYEISIGNSMVSRGIWHNTASDISKLPLISRAASASARPDIYAKYPVETMLLFVYNARLRNFTLIVSPS